jgi:hypothetical protein
MEYAGIVEHQIIWLMYAHILPNHQNIQYFVEIVEDKDILLQHALNQ